MSKWINAKEQLPELTLPALDPHDGKTGFSAPVAIWLVGPTDSIAEGFPDTAQYHYADEPENSGWLIHEKLSNYWNVTHWQPIEPPEEAK